MVTLDFSLVFFLFFVCPHRATIEEVEGDVCELESKLDKVSTTLEKHWLIVHLFYCVNWQATKAILCVENCRFVPGLVPHYIPWKITLE